MSLICVQIGIGSLATRRSLEADTAGTADGTELNGRLSDKDCWVGDSSWSVGMVEDKNFSVRMEEDKPLAVRLEGKSWLALELPLEANNYWRLAECKPSMAMEPERIGFDIQLDHVLACSVVLTVRIVLLLAHIAP